MAVYLLLGHIQDACCARVAGVLRARGHTVQVTPNPFAHPGTFSWRVGGDPSTSRITFADGIAVTGQEIAGVLVRGTGWVDSDGWEPRDHAYMQAETQAALLAWLWSLECPVVNRCSAAVWYRGHGDVLPWSALLWRSVLAPRDTLITNVDREVRAFRMELSARGLPGAVYGPLTSRARYLVSEENEWAGLEAMQLSTPVALSPPQSAGVSVCLVGDELFWSDKPYYVAVDLETNLRQLADEMGLQFVEFTMATAAEDVRVESVEPFARLENYPPHLQERIVEALCVLLTGEGSSSHASDAQFVWRPPA